MSNQIGEKMVVKMEKPEIMAFRDKAEMIASLGSREKIREVINETLKAGKEEQLSEALEWKQIELARVMKESRNMLDVVGSGSMTGLNKNLAEKHRNEARDVLSVAESHKKSVDFALNCLMELKDCSRERS